MTEFSIHLSWDHSDWRKMHLPYIISATYSIHISAVTLCNLSTSSLVFPVSILPVSAGTCLSAYPACQQMSVVPVVCAAHCVQTIRWQLMVLFISSIPPSPVTPLHVLKCISSPSLSDCLFSLFLSLFSEAGHRVLRHGNQMDKLPELPCLSVNKFFSLTTTLTSQMCAACATVRLWKAYTDTRIFFPSYYKVVIVFCFNLLWSKC